MTDVEYLLRQDVKEKKAAARGARARVCGSKTSYVSLPSDRLTKSQLKKRSGKVKTYNLNRPLAWKEIKELPPDLCAEYITRLRNVFGASYRDIGSMAGISASAVCKLAERLGLKEGRATQNREQKLAWRQFCEGRVDSFGKPLSPEEAQPEPTTPEPTTPEPEVRHEAKLTPARDDPYEIDPAVAFAYPSKATFTLRGMPSQIAAYMLAAMNRDTIYEVSIKFREASSERGDYDNEP